MPIREPGTLPGAGASSGSRLRATGSNTTLVGNQAGVVVQRATGKNKVEMEVGMRAMGEREDHKCGNSSESAVYDPPSLPKNSSMRLLADSSMEKRKGNKREIGA